ncbi:hypothetical protein G6F42_022816 [Rhizopus arrhizus]|nr:hypothetical protein G6F42_022816 [Rhizopus arrhizus]
MAPTACSDDFKPVINDRKPDPLPAPGVPLLPPSELVRKMRWITLGYQYHWPTKTYHLDRRYPFPADVSDLTKAVVTAVENIGHDGWINQYKGEDFKAEAGVINYYQYRDTLMGHVDRSEMNMEAPLVSLSLGQSCIYLIGGLTRETVPVPLLLKSGDIVVMTGPCRKAFHGVPLIIENTLPDYLSNNNQYDDAPDWKLFGDFMSTSRINLNIRQVYPKQQSEETPGISYHKGKHAWFLSTKNTSYVIGVDIDTGLVLNLYWGSRLVTFTDIDLDNKLAPERSSQDPAITSASEEFPVFGGLRYGPDLLRIQFESNGTRELDLIYKDGTTLGDDNDDSQTQVQIGYRQRFDHSFCLGSC